MGDVVNAVQNIGNEVAKGVNNVVAETGKGFDNLVKGDVGNAAKGLLAPQLGLVAAGGDVLKGDIKGALGRATGAQLSGATNLLGVSNDVRKFVSKNETLNTVSLGLASDAGKMHDSTNRMMATGEVRPEDLSNSFRYLTRAGTIATGVGLVTSGGASSLGSTALNAGKSGLGFLQGAGTVAAGAAAIAKNPGDAVKSYLGLDTSGFDDLIDNFNDIRNNVDTVRNVISPPSTSRAPAASGPTGSNAGVALPTMSGGLVPVILLVAGTLVGLVLFLGRKK